MILVVDYDPAWPILFESLRLRYETALRGIPVVSIEHVGSTAVGGLSGKAVIDIDIVVLAEDVSAACAALGAVGFQTLGENGIPQRWALRAPSNFPPTNTYVVEQGSLALRNHLAVRNVLRGDQELRKEYGNLKKQISETTADGPTYVEAKSALLSRILGRAGLDAAERAQIEAWNRRS